MKPLFLLFALLGLSLASIQAQSPATEASSGGAASTTGTKDPAVAFRDGQLFLVREHQVLRLEQNSLPEGQMLNADGLLVPLPANVTGFDESGAVAAATTSATAATTDPVSTGVTMRGGKLFLVRNGQAKPIDTDALGDSMMMSLDGRHVPIPDNIDFKSAGTIKPGSMKPGSATPGNVQGSSIKGPDIKGADVQGADVKGADVKGPDVKGPDVKNGN